MMDMNEYMLEIVVRDRLAELREAARRAHRARAARPVSHSVRVALGGAMIPPGGDCKANDHSVTKTDAGGRVVTRRTSAPGAVRG